MRTRLTTEQLTGIYRVEVEKKCSRLREIHVLGNWRLISAELRDRDGLNQSVETVLGETGFKATDI